MTKQEALQRYLESSLRGRKVIERLQKWDKTKTCVQNANALGIQSTSANAFRARFGLGSLKKRRSEWNMKPHNIIQSEAVQLLRKSGWDYSKIGKLFGFRRQRAEQIVKFHTTPLD